MQDLEKMKELHESGEWLLIGRNPNDFEILENPIWERIHALACKLIHKKHKHILDAWLLDNDVEIYEKYQGYRLVCDFIEEYDDSCIYELKEERNSHVKPKQIDLNNTWCEATPETRKTLDWQGVLSGKYFIINEYGLKSLKDYFPKSVYYRQIQLNKNNEFEYVEDPIKMNEEQFEEHCDDTFGEESRKEKDMTQVEHFRQYGFEVPEFECEILKDDGDFYIGYVKTGHDVYPLHWSRKGDALNHSGAACWDLTPIKKPWYEDESNFPCLLVSKSCDEVSHKCKGYDKKRNLFLVAGASTAAFTEWRKATNEEIESLKIKDE